MLGCVVWFSEFGRARSSGVLAGRVAPLCGSKHLEVYGCREISFEILRLLKQSCILLVSLRDRI